MGAFNRNSMCVLIDIDTSTVIGFYKNMRTGELRKTLSFYLDVKDNAMALETKKINPIQGDKDFF
jgi:hypothetical protein